jgi:heterodisulfide reductase subunit A2
MRERIGVYICHCGGNISDYVDVEELGKMLAAEEGVVISKDVMFACADSNQKQMVSDIQEMKLDAIVVASCSPKLHLHTFRNVADRAGLNPSNYVQVNIREQCSWPHSDNPKEATIKAVGLIRAGINRVTHSEPLENIEIPVVKAGLIIGAGVAGMRAAIDLARMGNDVYLIEKEKQVGGRVAQSGKLFMTGQKGTEVVEKLYSEIKKLNKITLFTGATVEKVSGSLGNFNVGINIETGKEAEKMVLNVGSVLVTTGMDTYEPKEDEFGFGKSEFVITLSEFNKLIEKTPDQLVVNSKKIRTISFIYCVGNRQKKGENKYCSRFCCTAAIHTSINIKEKYKDIKAYHLFRDIRTYGKQEILYEKSSKQGDIYIRFDEKEPPVVEAQQNEIIVKVKDYLTSKMELEIPVDLVVLVTGAVAREDSKSIANVFKIPIGSDRFFNEIHPKLKPVETVIKGVYIGGSCQGPKNISESIESSLSATAKMNALLCGGTISLDPVVARINSDACVWCGKCAEACDYDAISEVDFKDKKVAIVNNATCAGCGICAPICPVDAIELAQFTNSEIEGMIDGFMESVTMKEKEGAIEEIEEEVSRVTMKEYPQLWKDIVAALDKKSLTIPQLTEKLQVSSEIVTYHLMTMNKYEIVVPDGLDDSETYFNYKMKNQKQWQE